MADFHLWGSSGQIKGSLSIRHPWDLPTYRPCHNGTLGYHDDPFKDVADNQKWHFWVILRDIFTSRPPAVGIKLLLSIRHSWDLPTYRPCHNGTLGNHDDPFMDVADHHKWHFWAILRHISISRPPATGIKLLLSIRHTWDFPTYRPFHNGT